MLAVEKLLGTEVPERALWIRTLFDELTRIMNHLLNVTTFALDCGAMTPLLWMFEERETLMDIYEAVSGARMHANYYRFGGVPPGHAARPRRADRGLDGPVRPEALDDMDELLTENRIFKQRAVDIGVVSAEDALAWGFAGPMLRALGRALGPPEGAALRDVRPGGVRHPGRQARRPSTTATSSACSRCASCSRSCASACGRCRPGRCRVPGPEGDAAAARRDEALDGGADPPLQAVHRGRARARGRGLRRDREQQGRVRRLPGRATAPTSPTAARSARPASSTLRPWTSWAAATPWPTCRRSSARSTSCSGRSTGEPVRAAGPSAPRGSRATSPGAGGPGRPGCSSAPWPAAGTPVLIRRSGPAASIIRPSTPAGSPPHLLERISIRRLDPP